MCDYDSEKAIKAYFAGLDILSQYSEKPEAIPSCNVLILHDKASFIISQPCPVKPGDFHFTYYIAGKIHESREKAQSFFAFDSGGILRMLYMASRPDVFAKYRESSNKAKFEKVVSDRVLKMQEEHFGLKEIDPEHKHWTAPDVWEDSLSLFHKSVFDGSEDEVCAVSARDISEISFSHKVYWMVFRGLDAEQLRLCNEMFFRGKMQRYANAFSSALENIPPNPEHN